MSIRAIDTPSVHRITSGQVVVDLQTAVKELVENSLDAGATSIDVRFQHYGLKTIEIVDNGCGIAPEDHDTVALKHYTSKLATFEDLSRVLTFGFRGEALSSLCALTDGLTVTTATSSEAPMGTVIDMDRTGHVRSKCKVARQRGTTVTASNLFQPLPVRRKELERNAKREFQKALNMLHAYALVPCALENNGVRMSVSNQTEGGRKVVQFKTDGTPFVRASVLSVWGPKALENIVDLDLSFNVETEKSVQRRLDPEKDIAVVIPVKVQGLISKFAIGAGRASVDRQFFFVNGRPYNPGKVQKAINEVYRTFNANQSPFVIANIIVPTNACDINISPDKRTIFIHSENNLVQALKTELENAFSSARSTFDVAIQPVQMQRPQNVQQAKLSMGSREQEQGTRRVTAPLVVEDRTQPGRSPLPQPDPGNKDATGAEDRPPTMGAPRTISEQGGRDGGSGSETEPEPELTLVARPGPSDKGLQDDASTTRVDRPRRRSPSEPLFFPDSDDEEGKGTAADKGKQRECVALEENGDERASPVRRAATSATTSSTPSIHLARSSTDKPRSVQTVLSTRGAVWNLRRDGDGEKGGRERKRPRLSSEGDRVQAKKSFRSSLSQFLGGGKKALPDEKEEGTESEGDDGNRGKSGRGDSEELDELDEDEVEEHLGKRKKTRRRSGSQSSQGTVVVLSDDERMDVDEPPSKVAQRPRTVASPVRQTEDVEILSEDDWGISSTLVGTYVPPADKTTRSPADPDTDAVTLRVDLIGIGTHYLDMYARLSSMQPTPSQTTPSSTLRSAVTSANLDTAAEDAVASAALSRIISKADFDRMVIVGQFNLGFIIVRKRGEPTETQGAEVGMDDLFVVDQHAADEKWNFETLQESTVIASQKLFRPRELPLTAADEILAIENIDVLKRNGFELEQVEEHPSNVDEDEGGSESESVRVRLRLVAQPMSKETVFDMKDLEELIHLMQDRPRGTMVRCSKARAMFAMRACRRSVMIGKALDRPRMTAIVRHMGTMDQPWNCPHGRPTMRHLSDLRAFGGYVRTRRVIDWGAYGVLGSEMEEA